MPDKDPTTQAQFERALALHQKGQFADAEQAYLEILRQHPDHFDALHLLGTIAVQTQQLEHGVELIQKAIRLNGQIAIAHNNLGYALTRLGRFEEALANLDRAIALNPGYADAFNNRGI